jgi:hypothetical protein
MPSRDHRIAASFGFKPLALRGRDTEASVPHFEGD